MIIFAFTFAALPKMLNLPEVKVRTATSLTVQWREWKAGPDRGSGPVTGYFLYYRSLNTTQWMSVGPNITKPWTISGLDSNKQYEVKVAAVHQIGVEGPSSPAVSVKTCGSMSAFLKLLTGFPP